MFVIFSVSWLLGLSLCVQVLGFVCLSVECTGGFDFLLLLFLLVNLLWYYLCDIEYDFNAKHLVITTVTTPDACLQLLLLLTLNFC